MRCVRRWNPEGTVSVQKQTVPEERIGEWMAVCRWRRLQLFWLARCSRQESLRVPNPVICRGEGSLCCPVTEPGLRLRACPPGKTIRKIRRQLSQRLS